MNTFEQLTDLLHTKFDMAPEILVPTLSLSEYGLDSLSLAELLFTIEEDFHVTFPERPENIDTLAGLAAFIDHLRQQPATV